MKSFIGKILAKVDRRLQKFFANKLVIVLSIIFSIIVLLFVGVWKLNEAPPNVSGDEVTYLNDALRISDSSRIEYPWELMSYGIFAINHYPTAFVINMLADQHAVLGMRITSVILGIILLSVFYVYLRSKFSHWASFFATVALGTNYVFLNFSRSSWMTDGRVLGIACGLLTFIFIERAVREKKWYLTVLAGVFSGLGLYGYTGTKVFIVAVPAYLVYVTVRKRFEWKTAIKYLITFLFFTLIIALPMLLTVSKYYDSYMLRPRAVLVHLDRPYFGINDSTSIVLHQITYTARGFMLIDPAVSGQQLENQRYTPQDEAMVDPLTKILFFLGVIILFWTKKDIFLPTLVFFATLGMQALTEAPPNFSRGFFGLLFVYFIVGVFLDWLWNLKARSSYLLLIMSIILLGVCAWNVHNYFEWNKDHRLADARVYYIEYDQVPLWVGLEKSLISSNKIDMVITSPEWKAELERAGKQSSVT